MYNKYNTVVRKDAPRLNVQHLALRPWSTGVFTAPIWIIPIAIFIHLSHLASGRSTTVPRSYCWGSWCDSSYLRMVAFTTSRIGDTRGWTKFNSGQWKLINMRRSCRLSSLSKTLPVRSFSIHSIRSFSSPIIVVLLLMERECPWNEEGLGWSMDNQSECRT